MPDFQIRPANEADTPVILSLIHGLAEYEKARPQDLQVNEAMLRNSLFGPRPYAEVLLACIDDRAIGFAVFLHNFSTWTGRPGIYLEDLFVQPDRRGQGIGKALLRELARIARQRGCARIDWAVLDWNQPAIDFYKSLGAAPLDEWTTFRLTGEALDQLAGPPVRA